MFKEKNVITSNNYLENTILPDCYPSEYLLNKMHCGPR